MDARVFEVAGKRFKIRRLEKGDKEIFYDFFQALLERTKTSFHPHSFDRETAIKLCEEKDQDVTRFIVLDEGIIVGYAFLSQIKDDCPSLGICIRDDYQGQGFGKIVMNHLIEIAKSLGKKGLRLNVYEDNQSGVRLYTQLGFQVEKVTYSMRLRFPE